MSRSPNANGRGGEPFTLVGGDILGLITSGMYSNPLAIYREYLQNAADSIALSEQPYKGKVEIKIDVLEKQITIRDHGPGLSYVQAKKCLIPISQSNKRRQHDRGFRGVGRLAGLAFGGTVEFLTRHNGKSPITKITWDGDVLRNGIEKKLPLAEIIARCVTVERIDEGEYPANFFEVQIKDIQRYAASSILNRNIVRQYIGEICPVPFGENFPYINKVLDLFGTDNFPLGLEVRIDDDIAPITRLYADGITGVNEHSDKFVEFEAIAIPTSDSDAYAAVGWIAHSSYRGALRKSQGIRCLRARMGNIQIGDEDIFDSLFSEDRFNRWCVGEIHILDSRIVPNSRRDYLEPSVNLRNLENHLVAICQKLEQRCRMASKERNKHKRLVDFLNTLASTYELINSGCFTANTAKRFSAQNLFEISKLRNDYADKHFPEEIEKLNSLEENFKNLRFERCRNPLPGVSSHDARVYRKIFAILAETSASPQRAKQAIEGILNSEIT